MTTEDAPQDLSDAEAMQVELESLSALNNSRKERLHAEFGEQINPSVVTDVRLNSLLSLVLNPEARLRVELMTEATLGVMLDQALNRLASSRTRESLLAGVPGVDMAALRQNLAQ